MQKNFLDLSLEDILEWTKSKGLPNFRAEQIFEWQARGIADFQEMSNISKKVREELAQDFFPGLPQVKAAQSSQSDGSSKLLLAYPDGSCIEAVLMQHKYGVSACISTQVGCNMACAFCASTGLHKGRNLSCGELLGEFFALERYLAKPIDNLDLMGIGEPLDNYQEVLNFIKRLIDPNFRNFAVRKICLSTCGLVDKIRDLADEGLGITLSISLHAPTQKLRAKIMPVAKRYPLEELLSAADYYFQKTGRRISYEYALFADFNDTTACAVKLAELLKGRNCHVNLIPANAVPGRPFRASRTETVENFLKVLQREGINATLRRSLGQDIEAACGQLRRSALLEDRDTK